MTISMLLTPPIWMLTSQLTKAMGLEVETECAEKETRQSSYLKPKKFPMKAPTTTSTVLWKIKFLCLFFNNVTLEPGWMKKALQSKLRPIHLEMHLVSES
jgi:hypothetical protein